MRNIELKVNKDLTTATQTEIYVENVTFLLRLIDGKLRIITRFADPDCSRTISTAAYIALMEAAAREMKACRIEADAGERALVHAEEAQTRALTRAKKADAAARERARQPSFAF